MSLLTELGEPHDTRGMIALVAHLVLEALSV
jgi:hypothetical protein